MTNAPLRHVARVLGRAGAAAQNALEIARFGGLDTGEQPTPYEVVARTPTFRLRRYHADRAAERPDRPAIVLVPPLMLSTEVYDVAPATSAVAELAARGLDPFVVDFGAPEREEGGLDRTLTDHVLAVSDAIDRARELTGKDIHLSGYSQGGMFCYQAASYRRSEGIRSLITYGSPVNTRQVGPFGVPEELIGRAAGIAAGTMRRLALPAWAARTGFKLLDPIKAARQRVDFLMQLHNREALLEREGQRRFLDADGWVAYPGPAIAELLDQFVHHNRMLQGGFVIDGRLVTLADISCPTLCFVGTVDEIAPPVSVRGIRQAAPRADVHEVTMEAGHFGLVVGSKAVNVTYPSVAAWVHAQETGQDLPEGIVPMPQPGEDDGSEIHLQYGLELAANVGLNAARSVATAAEQTGRAMRAVAGGAVDQLPRLVRQERATRETRMSLGRLLDDQARRAPDDVFFLFEGRAHTYADAKRRIDNIVRGLVHVGVRQGEHVGVLMGTRPSAVAVVAALSRLGAVAVMLRPDGPLERELDLGACTRVIADPEHGELAGRIAEIPVLVLGGGGEPRELGFGLTDMERIDPDAVDVPAWYRANPGRAGDLAFVLFTGAGDRTRVNRITNRRWSLSAAGTASAAKLGATDTVYSITPIHHPSGLLTSIGGAVAGGARLALASSFDPETFWEEVRRYGVTIVSYTWTLCRDLVEAPVDPAERHHPVRLFVGSGMPSGLWRRVVERFGAGVLEFYASTEGEAVLANLTGTKVGAKGRPIPGSARVAVAAYDVAAGRLVVGQDGFAVRCEPGEVGMLLARVDRDKAGRVTSPLRGVFRQDDAWLATGDLFRVDEDGDHWLVDHLVAVMRTAAGPVCSVPIEDAFGALDGVDLVVAYGVRSTDDGDERIIAAVTERDGEQITSADLTAAAHALRPHERPEFVRLLDEMPRTTWARPRKVPLRAEGLPKPDDRAWVWDAEAACYVVLDDDAMAITN